MKSEPFISCDLQGRKVLITGGASGIGKAAAQLFIALGAEVVVADVQEEAVAHAADEVGARGWVQVDVSDEQGVNYMISETAGILGGLNAVFHCAGVHNAGKSLEQPIDEWQRVMDVNVRGTHLVCTRAAKHMADIEGGAIVVVSSIATFSGFPRRSAYGTSKAAVSYLTRCLACEWGELGIRVNCIAPGYTLTPMAQSIVAEGNTDAARIENRTPLHRFAEPIEIARAAAFLLSNWASYITGAELFVDGGWSAFGASGEVQTF